MQLVERTSARPASKLNGGQIRGKLAGMEFTDEIHLREFYERSDKVTSNSMGRKRSGQWRVEKDRVCVEYEKEPPAKCYEVWAAGKKIELRGEGLLPVQGVLRQATGPR
jgi:hypothetical protein